MQYPITWTTDNTLLRWTPLGLALTVCLREMAGLKQFLDNSKMTEKWDTGANTDCLMSILPTEVSIKRKLTVLEN